MKFTKSQFLSKKEEDFFSFCQKNGIKFQLSSKDSGRGENIYSLSFQPEFIDQTEKQIVEYCDKMNIEYQFVVDKDGYHHYSFPNLIELYDDNPVNIRQDRRIHYRNTLDDKVQDRNTFDQVLDKVKDSNKFDEVWGEVKEEKIQEEIIPDPQFSWFQRIFFSAYCQKIIEETQKKRQKARTDYCNKGNAQKQKIVSKKDYQHMQLKLAGVKKKS